ncbi:unnamed protein product [Psylliodes chrysocephalus]|uniref:Uncharacterized protein n=1 Tax=Psylliodes chrysocephalus TaxID=3402493 RepID=A0A9P0D6D7_9CUCU|nr:unnamed protein product [Psylliodes chrysocephala]
MNNRRTLKRKSDDVYNPPAKIARRRPSAEDSEIKPGASSYLPEYLKKLMILKNELKKECPRKQAKARAIEYKILNEAVVLALTDLLTNLKKEEGKEDPSDNPDQFTDFLRDAISGNIKDRLLHSVLDTDWTLTKSNATSSAVKKMLKMYREKEIENQNPVKEYKDIPLCKVARRDATDETKQGYFNFLPKYLQDFIKEKNGLRKPCPKSKINTVQLEHSFLSRAAVLELKHFSEKTRREIGIRRLMPVPDEFPKYLQKIISLNVKDRMYHQLYRTKPALARYNASTNAVKKMLKMHEGKEKYKMEPSIWD